MRCPSVGFDSEQAGGSAQLAMLAVTDGADPSSVLASLRAYAVPALHIASALFFIERINY